MAATDTALQVADIATLGDIIARVAISLAIVAALIGGLYLAHRRTTAYYASRNHVEFRRQLIMLGLTLLAVLLAIVLMPLGKDLRGEMLGLFGIVLSATIALSSTTLVGNAMAGIMLRTIRSFGPGDYVHVGEHFGRISEIDLMHTEIQTEERDLTTLPNLYMVTHPVRVLRESGTILSVEISLGYDVPRPTIEKLLREAALETGLESPFVQIRNLGDYSISYAIAGLLTEVKHLLSKRRELRARTIDALHGAGIEIASPTLHSIRQFPQQHQFIPPLADTRDTVESDDDTASDAVSPDSLIFDKAYEAESLEKQRQRLDELSANLRDAEAALKEPLDEPAKAAALANKEQIEKRIALMKTRIADREAQIGK